MIDLILFDLDDTLYPRHSGIMEQIRIRIHDYVRTHLGLSDVEADRLRRHYFVTYGTTMRGLQIIHNIDPGDYLLKVHDIPLQEHIEPNPELDAVLAAIPQRKVVFTNSSREHAEGVLGILGIGHHFERIVDIRDMEYESKPQPGAYTRICDMLGVQPQACMLIEDNVNNLRPAKAIGMTTVLVDGDGPDTSVDHTLDRIEDLGVFF